MTIWKTLKNDDDDDDDEGGLGPREKYIPLLIFFKKNHSLRYTGSIYFKLPPLEKNFQFFQDKLLVLFFWQYLIFNLRYPIFSKILKISFLALKSTFLTLGPPNSAFLVQNGVTIHMFLEFLKNVENWPFFQFLTIFGIFGFSRAAGPPKVRLPSN